MASLKFSTGGTRGDLATLRCGGLLRGCLPVFELGHDTVEARRAHEPLVNVASGLLSEAQGVRDVGCAGNGIAAGIELVSAGFESEAIHFDDAGWSDLETRAACEIRIHSFAYS
jgi:hypothetical protein